MLKALIYIVQTSHRNQVCSQGWDGARASMSYDYPLGALENQARSYLEKCALN